MRLDRQGNEGPGLSYSWNPDIVPKVVASPLEGLMGGNRADMVRFTLVASAEDELEGLWGER